MSLKDFSVVDEIDVGVGNRGIGITDDGKKLIIAVRSKNDLAIINLTTKKVEKRIYIGENPEFVRVLGDNAFVSFEPAAIGGPPPKPGSQKAIDLKLQRESDDEDPARIAIVDISKGVKVSEIIGGMETEGIEFSIDESEIIVTNEADENLSVHNIKTGKLIKKIETIKFGNRPRGIKKSPNKDFYLATLEYGNKLIKINKEYEIDKVVDTGLVPYGIAFSPDGMKAYVALSSGKSIQVFNTNTMLPINEIPTGDRCWHFSFTPDLSHIISACGRSNEILIINSESGKIVKKISSTGMPWGVVTYPKSPGTLDTSK
jgi:DNA-binding beta-propeller fold protein YncE